MNGKVCVFSVTYEAVNISYIADISEVFDPKIKYCLNIGADIMF